MNILKRVLIGLSPRKLAECGHLTKRTDFLDEGVLLKMPKNNKGTFDYCHECLKKMTIKCTWCQEKIYIGDRITLYVAEEDFMAPDGAVCYNEEKRQYVGCLSYDCADSAADIQGIWMPPGKVMRIPSPFEKALKPESLFLFQMFPNILDNIKSLKALP